MRTTFNSQYRDLSAAIESASDRLIDFQRQVATGRRLNRPSDDPAAAATVVTERSRLGAIEQYAGAADSVGSRLAVADTVFSDIIDKLSAARVAGMSVRGTEASETQRAAVAQEVEGLRDALVDDFNASFRGMYLFAGAASASAPYTVTGGTVGAYGGSATEVEVDIGDDRAVTVGFNGEALTQGSAAQDVFAFIDTLVAGVEAGDSDAIGTALGGIEAAFTRVVAAQSRLGVDMQSVEAQKLRLERMRLSADERLGQLEGANMTEAITNMQQADASYRAALGAAAAATRLSLLDYLK
jgi:flagellar hook-associated protein 3 FlgL